jgi:hypothetical protein
VNLDNALREVIPICRRENTEPRTAGDTEKPKNETGPPLFLGFRLVMDFCGHQRTWAALDIGGGPSSYFSPRRSSRPKHIRAICLASLGFGPETSLDGLLRIRESWR